MLGVAMRIAERIGIHNESLNARCPVVEAEIRRRLWWSLSSFDSRICEIAGFKMKSHWMTEDWVCKLPLNVNDFDIRPEMQTPPEAHKTPTEAIFTVVRSELNDYIRRLFIQPKDASFSMEAAQIALGADIEERLQEKYFRFCNPENPLHFMTIWSSQAILSKTRLVLRYSVQTPEPGSPQEATQRDLAFGDALKALEADTKLVTSPLTKCFTWFLNMYFPFPAYVHLVGDLKERPMGEHAEQAWQTMSDNMVARAETLQHVDTTLIRIFGKRILAVWDIREAALGAMPGAGPIEPPELVTLFRQLQNQWSTSTTPQAQYGSDRMEIPSSVPTMADQNANLSASDFQYSNDIPVSLASLGSVPDPFAQAPYDFNMGSMDWNTMYWTRLNQTGWW